MKSKLAIGSARILVLVSLSAASFFSQAPPMFSQAPPIDARKLYASQCSGCHGADARGTDRGPALAASKSVRARSFQQLRTFIRRGAAGAGLPGFDLPSEQLDALTVLIRSLHAP